MTTGQKIAAARAELVGQLSRGLTSRAPGTLLVRATLGSFGVRIASMALIFLVGVQLARGLGADGYGIYALAMSVASLLSVVVQFGLPNLVTREVAVASNANDWGKVAGILHWSDRIIVAVSVLVLAFLLCLWTTGYGVDQPGFGAALFWGALMIPIVSLGKVRDAALRGLNHIVTGQVAELALRPALFAGALAVAFYFSDQEVRPGFAMALHFGACIVTFLASVTLLFKHLPAAARLAVPVTQGREWLKSAVPMALTEGLRIAQGSLVIILIGVLGSASAVGIFRVGDRLALMCALPLSLINVVVAPSLAESYAEKNYRRLQRVLRYSALAMAGGVVLLALPFLIQGERLLEIVFGPEYEGSLTPLWIMCGSQILSSLCGPNATLLNMTGHERRVTAAFALALTASVLAALFFIPRYGATGGALSVAAGSVAWNTVLSISAVRLTRVDPTIFSWLRRDHLGS